MSISLEEAFKRYVCLVDEEIRPRSRPSKTNIVRLVPNSNVVIRESVAKIEAHESFQALVVATASAIDLETENQDLSSVKRAIRNYFRRSGHYMSVAKGKILDQQEDFANYNSAFQQKEVRHYNLALIEGVWFDKDQMEFEGFQIRRFTDDELEKILGVEIEGAFNKWEVTDIEKLSDYWYIVTQETIPRTFKTSRFFNRLNLAESEIKRKFTAFPQFSEALLPLISFELQSDQQRKESLGRFNFDIPLTFSGSNNPTMSPSTRPPIEKLARNTVIVGPEFEEVDAPFVHTRFDEDETHQFKEFINSIAPRISQVQFQREWEFFDLAGQYLLKGFFAKGLEQLLWHITTLEALVGESGPGSTNRLRDRVVAIMGDTKNQKKHIRKRLDILYDFRSKLVHGAPFKEQVLKGHLREAREFARLLYAWFASFLKHTQDAAASQELALPSRETLLKMIDLDAQDRDELETIVVFMRQVPNNFPRVKEWFDDQ